MCSNGLRADVLGIIREKLSDRKEIQTMSREYDLYLQNHKANVKKGFDWIKENLPDLIPNDDGIDYEHQIGFEEG